MLGLARILFRRGRIKRLNKRRIIKTIVVALEISTIALMCAEIAPMMFPAVMASRGWKVYRVMRILKPLKLVMIIIKRILWRL